MRIITSSPTSTNNESAIMARLTDLEKSLKQLEKPTGNTRIFAGFNFSDNALPSPVWIETIDC